MLCNVDRARDFMARHGVSALVATTMENVTYLSDFDNPLPFYTFTNAAAVLPANAGRPGVFVTAVAYLAHLTESPTWMPVTKVFGSLGIQIAQGVTLPEPEASTVASVDATRNERHPSLPAALASALEEAGAVDGPIAIDDIRVVATLPDKWRNHTFIDGSNMFKEIRMVKTAEEIERLRVAASLNERGFIAAANTVKVGGSWQDVTNAWRVGWASGGGTAGFWGAGSGAHSAQIYPAYVDYEIKKGDAIRWEGGGWWRQYWADGGRTSAVGEANDRMKKYVQALIDGNTVAREVIRPGAKGVDVIRAVWKAIQATIPEFQEENAWGHGIGLTANELPRVRPGVDITLEPGMVLCFETPYFELGWGGIQMEDTYVVTETGNDVLTKMDTALNILDGGK